MKKIISALAISVATMTTPVAAQDVAALNDLEFAHIAYTADNIDIRYAHLALAICLSTNTPTITTRQKVPQGKCFQ